MTGQAQSPANPTSRQLAFIRDLNTRAGTDFSHPGTVEEARQQIERLTALCERQELAITRFTQLVEDSGLPQPDDAQRDGGTVRFVWNDRKVMVLVDLDEDPTDPAGGVGALLAA